VEVRLVEESLPACTSVRCQPPPRVRSTATPPRGGDETVLFLDDAALRWTDGHAPSPSGARSLPGASPSARAGATDAAPSPIKASPHAKIQSTGPIWPKEVGHSPIEVPAHHSALHPLAVMEGWLQLLGGSLQPAAGRAAEEHMGELLGPPGSFEPANASGSSTPACVAAGPPGPLPPQFVPPGPTAEGFVWASLCCCFLLLAASPLRGSPAAAPHALLDVRRVRPTRRDDLRLELTLSGVPVAASDSAPPILIVLLLPDGRWKEQLVDELVVKVTGQEELARWEVLLNRTRVAAAGACQEEC